MSEGRIELNQEQATSGGGACWGDCNPDKAQPAQDNAGRPYDHLFKLILLGDRGVGKTSLITRFTDDIFIQDSMCSIGVDFKMRTIQLDGKRIKLQLWDVGGSERFRSITAAYYRGAHGILLLYDTTNQESINNTDNRWLKMIRQYSREDCIIMLIGTKCDLTAAKIVEYQTAKEFAEQQGMLFIETSSKDNINVEEAFITLAAEVKRHFTTVGQ